MQQLRGSSNHEKAMNLLQALLFPLVLLVLSSTSTLASVLEDTCKSFATSHTDIGYDYCLKFFQADKGSVTADKRGLAVIAVRITGEAARSTARRIAALKASAKDKRVVQCLGDCAQLYSSAQDQTAQAARGIASGNSGDLQNAVTALSAVLDAPDTCEQGFQDLQESSPLATEDAEFSRDAAIALSATSALFK